MSGAECARGRWRPGSALQRAFALLLLSTLAAPVSHAALFNASTSATIRVVAADVGAHSFSASLRATSTQRVNTVNWVVWDTAACNGTTPPSFAAGKDCNGATLDDSRSGQVDLVRPPRSLRTCAVPLTPRGAQKTLWLPVEVRVGPGLLSQTNSTLLLADTWNVIGACGARRVLCCAPRVTRATAQG